MKKILVVLFVLLLVIVAGIYFIVSNLDYFVKLAIEQYGSQVTQTAVRVDRVKIDLQKGSAGIYGLTVANPKGFDSPTAFTLGESSVRIDLDSLRNNVIVLDAVTVRAPKVSYEMNAQKQGSLNVLYDSISKSLPAGGGSGPGAAADSGPKMIIRSLVFENGAIDARLVPLDNKLYNLKLPAIRMRNLGAPKGATASELAKEILSRMTREARDQVKKELIDKRLGQAIDVERKKLESAAQQKLDEEKKKTEQRLKDMLKL